MACQHTFGCSRFAYFILGIMVLLLITVHYFYLMHFRYDALIGRMKGHRQHAYNSDEFGRKSPPHINLTTDSDDEQQIRKTDGIHENEVTKVVSGAELENATTEEGKGAQRLAKEQYMSTKQMQPLKRIKSKRYLLPLFDYVDGPSGLYIHIRFAIFAAIYQNRTLVIPYLHKHLTQTTGPEQRTPDETFDMAKLKDIVSVSSLDDFKRDCGTHFTLGNITEGPYPEDTAVEFKLREYGSFKRQSERMIGITLPDESEIPLLLKNVSERFNAMLPVKCLGYLTSRDQVFNNKEIEEKIGKNFLRAPYIRRMADEVTGKICDGSFAVMQWRNKTAENCRFRVEGIAPEEECTESVKKNLAILSEHVDTIIGLVWETLYKHNISCLYVCTPPYEQKMVDTLKKSKYVHTIHDALQLSDELAKHKEDNYIISLVEQEMAEKTPLFISCGGSQWSRFVGYARNENKLKTIPLRQIPGIPKYLLSIRYLIK
ncbi:uncharacterized protein [Ptychodera flava]|uniref:uncharacterized protein n=1 Tax=Ptychodera flava TaxID=63121 RepID=UPI00396A040B